MRKPKRFEVSARRPMNQDGLIGEWPEEGSIAMEGPCNLTSSVKVESGRIIELDGKSHAEFNMIDRLIADYAVNVVETERAMQLDALEIARMLVDIRVSQEEIIAIITTIIPTKVTEVMT